MERSKQLLFSLLGIDLESVSHRERILSAIGGFLGIFSIVYINHLILHDWGVALIVASMGASAVLLFAVPHGKLSQPWPLIGGHLVSAVVGVTCYKWVPDLMIAAALAVGVAILLMHYLRCVHPPGGATALSFVIGPASLHDLGYSYIYEPVLINVLLIFVVTVLFNLPFVTRRYPQGLQNWISARAETKEEGVLVNTLEISREDITAAIEKLDIVMDVTDKDLLKLYELATSESRSRHLPNDRILLGHYYTNGGEHWTVRQIVDESVDRDQVIYRIVAGHEQRNTGVCSIDVFARWARFEVVRDGKLWRHVSDEILGRK